MGRVFISLVFLVLLYLLIRYAARLVRAAWRHRPGQWVVVAKHGVFRDTRRQGVWFIAKKGYDELPLDLKLAMSEEDFESKLLDLREQAEQKVAAMNLASKKRKR